eukprot:8872714-Alexandrium_andersonii.AAC.1
MAGLRRPAGRGAKSRSSKRRSPRRRLRPPRRWRMPPKTSKLARKPRRIWSVPESRLMSAA